MDVRADRPRATSDAMQRSANGAPTWWKPQLAWNARRLYGYESRPKVFLSDVLNGDFAACRRLQLAAYDNWYGPRFGGRAVYYRRNGQRTCHGRIRRSAR